MATADGLKLVAGLVIDTEIGPQFVCGGLVDMGEDKGSKFVPGQVGVQQNGLIILIYLPPDAWRDQKRSGAIHPWPDGGDYGEAGAVLWKIRRPGCNLIP